MQTEACRLGGRIPVNNTWIADPWVGKVDGFQRDLVFDPGHQFTAVSEARTRLQPEIGDRALGATFPVIWIDDAKSERGSLDLPLRTMNELKGTHAVRQRKAERLAQSYVKVTQGLVPLDLDPPMLPVAATASEPIRCPHRPRAELGCGCGCPRLVEGHTGRCSHVLAVGYARAVGRGPIGRLRAVIRALDSSQLGWRCNRNGIPWVGL
jgi:hypothetical protein